MDYRIKKTLLTDGSPVFDVEVYANGGGPVSREAKCIFSCNDKKAAEAFAFGVGELIKAHTVETWTRKPSFTVFTR